MLIKGAKAPRLARARPAWSVLLIILLLACRSLPAAAQEEGKSSAATPAAGTSTGTATGADASLAEDVTRVDSNESFLAWMARASGPIGVVIAVMSFYLIALVVWMALRYREEVAMPRRLIHQVEESLRHKNYSEAYHRLAADRSMLARVLSAGVRKLPSGLPLAQRAMELANEEATMEMEHRTTYLATVGTLGPMIGLVGTVYGMILAFRVIATEGSAPQASQLAAGISTALFATLLGIGISIPAIFFYSMYRNRIARLSLEVALAAEPLLEEFAPGVRAQDAARPAQPTAAPTTAPTPPPAQATPVTTSPALSHPHPYATHAVTAARPSRSALPPADPQS